MAAELLECEPCKLWKLYTNFKPNIFQNFEIFYPFAAINLYDNIYVYNLALHFVQTNAYNLVR